MFGNVSEQFVSLKEYYCAGVGGGDLFQWVEWPSMSLKEGGQFPKP